MHKLVNCQETALGRGAVFRFRAKYPYEDVVDYMLLYDGGSDRSLAMIVSSGHKAGHLVIRLPNECLHEGTGMLSVEWLKQNWTNWVYPDCPVEDVYYLHKYPVPEYPT